MNDDDDGEDYSWTGAPGAQEFLRELRRQRAAWLEALIGAAGSSQDANVRSCWARHQQLNETIQEMEEEHGKSD